MPKLILWFPLSIAILRNNALGEIKLIQAAARCCKCCCNACCTSSWNQELIGAIILSQGLVYGGWSTYMEPHPGIWPQVSSVQGKHALPICQLVHYFIMFAWDFLLNWQTQNTHSSHFATQYVDEPNKVTNGQTTCLTDSLDTIFTVHFSWSFCLKFDQRQRFKVLPTLQVKYDHQGNSELNSSPVTPSFAIQAWGIGFMQIRCVPPTLVNT